MEIEVPGSESVATRDRFNNSIAVAVALVSAFMAVSKIKDDNVVQAMQKAQAETVERVKGMPASAAAAAMQLSPP